MPEYTYYIIVCKDDNIKDCYVGKTKNFKKRIQIHKSDCNNINRKIYNIKLYQYMRENGNINNWNFIQIEKGEYDNKDSAIKERELIEKFNATLNIVIPSRTRKEYEENNREIIKEKNIKYKKEFYEKNAEIIKNKVKDYRKNNKEKIKEKDKQYYEKNVEIISEKQKEYREKNREIIKEKKKEFYENNKEYFKEKHKHYRENNKEIISQKQKEKITCQCGCEINKNNLSRHLKSKKHIKLMS